MRHHVPWLTRMQYVNALPPPGSADAGRGPNTRPKICADGAAGRWDTASAAGSEPSDRTARTEEIE
ncbi:hypothetical protein GCM10010381_47570 [Streptomyces xantholiticus]|nr:hypothetical protein GCM10010381_47570 [Streptomyces xantholiticus]